MLSPQIILIAIISYFVVLTAISYFTGKEDNNEVFFNAKRSSNWAVVAFGMVGTSLSGVTFISVPGWIKESNFTYLQVVIGYIFGYFVVAFVLLPIYYNTSRLTPKRRKKKKVSEKELRLIQEHEKFLKRMGVGKYIPPLKT